jgi:hypothetical protein
MRQFGNLPVVVGRILAGPAGGCLIIVERQTRCLASGETASGWMRQDTRAGVVGVLVSVDQLP